MNQLWINKLRALKVMPVIQLDHVKDAVPLARVLMENGLPAAEITFRTEAAAESIAQIRRAYPEMLLCAGTVLTKEQVDLAKLAGADFVISPGFNPNTVQHSLDQGILIIPGVNNPSSIEGALEMGISLMKFFPAEASGGLMMLKALVGPYRQIQLMPTGGVSPINLLDYLSVPQVVACGGTWLAPTTEINLNNWSVIAKNVQNVLPLINR
jgi:2-dehydro-3-deoxyphosphogluconate aldolase/(4S)-4-hydroxy-2-oxoglutarate aldolase